MKIVIDIPERTYKYAKKYANSPILSVRDIDRCMDAISKGEIEQEPILDKIRSEIKTLSPEPTAYDVVDGNPIKDAVWEIIADVLKIIDKYKAESEDNNGM